MAESKDKKLPVYEMRVSKDDAITGVQAVSLVRNPAIQVSFKMFSEQKQRLSEEIRRVKLEANGVRYCLTGPLLIPGQQIYRIDDVKGEYLANTSVEGIRAMVEKYSAGGFQNNTTLEHEIPLYGNTVIESWIIEDSKNDKAKALGFDLPVGTWMITMKVNDKRLWEEEIVTGKRLGFSLEGFFKDIKVDLSHNQAIQTKRFNMPLNYNTPYTLEDGNTLTIKESGEAVLQTEGGEEAAPDGSHTTIEGLVVLTEGGYVVSVTFPKPASSEEMTETEVKEFAALFQKFAKANGIDAKGVDPATLFGADGKSAAKQSADEKKAEAERLEAEKAKELEKSASLWEKFNKSLEKLVSGIANGGSKKKMSAVAPTKRTYSELILPSGEKWSWPDGETAIVVTDENGKRWKLVIEPADVEAVMDSAQTGEPVDSVGLLMKEVAEQQKQAFTEMQAAHKAELSEMKAGFEAQIKALRSNTVPPSKTPALKNDNAPGGNGAEGAFENRALAAARQNFAAKNKRTN